VYALRLPGEISETLKFLPLSICSVSASNLR
jgi:hypothetical protein